MNVKKDFGQRLKELRSKKGITQYRLAEITGIDPKHMSHIETGRSFPKSDLIEKFAQALDVEYTEFFKTQHIDNRTSLLSKIDKSIKSATDNDLQMIYKLICACVN